MERAGRSPDGAHDRAQGLLRGLAAAGALTTALGLCVVCCGGSGGTQNPPAGDGGTSSDMPGGGGDMTGVDPEAQRPLQVDEGSIDTWLKTNKYKQWRCETAPVSGRSLAHSQRSRVCSNDALIKSTAAPYPVNAVSVLELYDTGGTLTGYAMSIRTAEGDGGQNRFWFEVRGTTTTSGQGEAVCTSCHINATSDYTYLRAP